jgi:hypothetical protein
MFDDCLICKEYLAMEDRHKSLILQFMKIDEDSRIKASHGELRHLVNFWKFMRLDRILQDRNMTSKKIERVEETRQLLERLFTKYEEEESKFYFIIRNSGTSHRAKSN